MPDILFIVLLALVMFGPRRLPELAAHAGKYLALFSRMKRDLMEQMEAEITKVCVAEEVGKAASEPVVTSAQNRN